MINPGIEDRIQEVRRFNRFITRQIGVLHEGLLESPYTLTEARIIFELAQQRGNLTATDLSQELGLDTGYLSRILARLEQQGLLERVRSTIDSRQRLLHLTAEGEKAFQLLNNRSRDEVASMLGKLSEKEQSRLLQAMKGIEEIWGGEKSSLPTKPYVLRTHEPGDMGWVTYRHGALYFQEYGWDEHFEALVAQITADFVNHFNPSRERCWIAEMDGEIIGSIFLVQASETAAKLRLLLVEPKARGLGLGSHLVEECIRFAKRRGYQKIVLWTNSVLTAARHIYQKAGFELVDQEEHHSFGHDLVGETWELNL
jgi:DNA-binding MarR family transcriptional regulator/N-acetylglutamate synthase-like GNAT family acetyltransferase